MKKKYIIWTVVVLVIVAGILVFVLQKPEQLPEPVVEEVLEPEREVVGASVQGRNIESYTFGSGEKSLLFVGGVHGGYEWNSVVLAYEFIDYLEGNPDFLPENVAISIIPNANPDGVYKIIGKEGRFMPSDAPSVEDTIPGRFNARDVDLNRNFDCKWQPESTWRGQAVSAGTAPFSEPEARAIRDFVLDNRPDAVVFWHSQANTVYASECEDGVLPETLDIMNAYAQAAGYNTQSTFDAYVVTGDAEGWLASIGIPAITVELETHETVEWERNKRGVQALFEYYNN